MPIDPAADDGGLTFLWLCTLCPNHGLHLAWIDASRSLRQHRADQHGLYTPEVDDSPRIARCIDCDTPVLVQRIRQPRCDIHQQIHNRMTAKARRTVA